MNFQYLRSIFCVTMTLDLWLLTHSELFTATSDIEPLLNTQKLIIDNLDDYIASEEKKIAVLRKYLNRYKEEHILAMRDISDYIENPINAFTLIKRLTIDLDFIQNSMSVKSDYVKHTIANIPDVTYPTLEDLKGAVEGLTRLQKTYLLDIGDVAEGRLIGKISRDSKDSAISIPMTASDCFELGRILYDEKDFQNSLHWMMVTLRKLKSEDDLYNISEVDVLEKISFTLYLLGDIKTSFEWTKKLLALHPEYLQTSGNVENFQKIIIENGLKMMRKGETEEYIDNDDADEQSKTSFSHEEESIRIYEALCRGEINIPKEIKRRLKCTYLTKNHPFLKLAPIKTEQIYTDPDVFIFHEVMSDEEIEHIKNIAKPSMTRAEVHDPDTGLGMTAYYRISKVGWADDESEVVARVTQRVADFTGFSMDTAEYLQVANYGIGGHYEPHYDFEEEESAFRAIVGNRIATVLFYMSDVAEGGATVFTELGLTVFPIKNSALFWNNLLPSGEGDDATMHAACPVLRGSKWASNKWIHEFGQEFLKPCVA